MPSRRFYVAASATFGITPSASDALPPHDDALTAGRIPAAVRRPPSARPLPAAASAASARRPGTDTAVHGI
ncbi:hypothetical protein C8R44DRAFT_886830 [Mycena epipterygia]|nr:hypothetical protein C8R44DRAFT_886830 [Mycena epipterygia]